MDYEAVTTRQQAVWATGDFHRIGVLTVHVSERLLITLGTHAGAKVLDVAAGAGNTGLAAARRFADVTVTDYVPDLLERARTRAEAEGLPLRTEVADAQALPYPDGSFDVVTSTFGAMFAPDQERTAAELLRVLRPGGALGMANWTPTGFIGEMFALNARHVPPPPGLRPPTRWGTAEGLAELLGDDVTVSEQVCDLVFPSREHMLEHYRRWFGPTATAFASLDEAGQRAYADDLLALYAEHNVADDGTVLLRAPYLEVVARRA